MSVLSVQGWQGEVSSCQTTVCVEVGELRGQVQGGEGVVPMHSQMEKGILPACLAQGWHPKSITWESMAWWWLCWWLWDEA